MDHGEIELTQVLNKDDETELAVCVRDGCKTYGSNAILENVNITVPKGAIYGLLGPSGCGKTTLLSCIIGLQQFDSGQVSIFGGFPTTHYVARKVSFMPQQISLCNKFTIKESIKFFGWIMGLSTSKIEERLELLTRLLCLPSVHKRVENLSGGEQRRVSLAIALLHETELLILDEPTVGLDPILREIIWGYLVNLIKTKAVTIILTTHYMDEARQANKIGLMRKGEIVFEGTPINLLLKYSSDTLDEAFYKVIVTRTYNKDGAFSNPLQIKQEDLRQDKLIKANNLKALLWKNFLWMAKNYQFMVSVFFLPVMTVFLFGYAIGGDPRQLSVGVVNYETSDTNCDVLMCNSTSLSCHFLKYLDKDTMHLIPFESEEEAETSVLHGKTYASIIIRKNYTKNLILRLQRVLRSSNSILEGSTITIIYDPAITDISYFIKGYFYEKFKNFTDDYFESCGVNGRTMAVPFRFFDPVYGLRKPTLSDLASPGVLLSMVFFLTSGLTAGITVVERQEGILERSLVLGANLFEISAAHMIALFAAMVMQCVCPLLVFLLFFNITANGSIVLVFVLTMMCGFSGMCLG
ncbi:hypothetical protein FQA39_LY01930 [Lamprigera yunnana]|nr:hypothetical protein FQA39_LY01930 [Lamprigera yunnana]